MFQLKSCLKHATKYATWLFVELKEISNLSSTISLEVDKKCPH